MTYQKISKPIAWTVNPGFSKVFDKWRFEREVEKYCDHLRVIELEEDGRMIKRLANLDKGSESVRTVIGGIPNEALVDLLGIGQGWSISHVVIDIYDEEAIERIISEELEKYRLRQRRSNRASIREPRPEVWVYGNMEIHVELANHRFSCPVCGCDAKVHQWEERRYSHVKAFGCTTTIVARIPKLRCDCCRSWPQLEPGWARAGASFTIRFEKTAFSLIRNTTVSCVKDIFDITSTTLWRMIDYRVEEALTFLDLSHVFYVYIDEKSKRKGHDYVTVFLDQKGSVIFVCDGRDSNTLYEFSLWLESHNGRVDNILAFSCDLGQGYPSGIRKYFHNATIVYDHYHTMKILDEHFEEVYVRHVSNNTNLKRKRRLLQKREKDLDDDQRRIIRNILSNSKELGDAYRLREMFSVIFELGSKEAAEEYFEYWVEMTIGCEIPEMVSAAKSIERYKEGILNWYDHPINNGLIEGVNSAIQTMKQDARGFGNDRHYINMIYLKCGNLKLTLDPDFHYPNDGRCYPINGMVLVRCPNCGNIGYRRKDSMGRKYDDILFVDSGHSGGEAD